MGNSIRAAIGGAILGHIYYFLVDALPISYGYNLIKTPLLFVDMVSYMSGRTQISSNTTNNNNTTTTNNNTGEVPYARRQSVGGTTGYSWGRGRTLGSS